MRVDRASIGPPRRTAPSCSRAGTSPRRAPTVVGAVAEAAKRVPGLRGSYSATAPSTRPCSRRSSRLHAEDIIRAPGFVEATLSSDTLREALCLLLPSRREGYGLIVVEAAAEGVPSIVVAGPDNAATELISEGENGLIARSPSPVDLADAIVAVSAAGPAMREATASLVCAERGAALAGAVVGDRCRSLRIPHDAIVGSERASRRRLPGEPSRSFFPCQP